MKASADYHQYLHKKLKNPAYAIGYLNECFNDEDDRVFLLGLRHVAKAHGGIKKLAVKSGMNREHLFRMLSKKGNPRLESLRAIAHAFGWRLAFIPEEHKPLKKAA